MPYQHGRSIMPGGYTPYNVNRLLVSVIYQHQNREP
jgi:hypothetical protein